MNQMMDDAAGWMSDGMGMLPLVWVLTLALLAVLIRKNSKIRQLGQVTAEKGLRRRSRRQRRSES